jgi:putative ABC transport system permease protein
MSYSLATLWHERQRYLPGVLAVAFSALLIALQCGLLLGLFSITSIPVDHTTADIWVGSPDVVSVDLGGPISESFSQRVASQWPEVTEWEFYNQGFAYLSKPQGGRELCMVIGSRLNKDSLGLLDQLKERDDLLALLTEPGAIVIDESDLSKLGVQRVGDKANISGQTVTVVGLVRGIKSLAGPYVFCSDLTARTLLKYTPGQTTYILSRSTNPRAVVDRLNAAYKDDLTAITHSDFSYRTRMHWLTKTKAGIALGFAAALGLLVGAVVTSQTLYAATVASLREFAVLRALGIPRWRMASSVVSQSFWVGMTGVALALPTAFGLAYVAERLRVPLPLPGQLLAAAAAITLVTALFSGLFALRSLRQIEPATLLR